MRILLVNTFFPPIEVGGAEKSVHELANQLVDLGHEVAIMSLIPPGADVPVQHESIRVYRMVSRATAPFFHQSTGKLRWVRKLGWHIAENLRISAFIALRRVVTTEKPDVIHTNAVGGIGAVAWLAAPKVPRVHTLRDFYLLCTSFRTYKKGQNCESPCVTCRFARVGVARAAERSAAVVSISKSTAVRHQTFGAFQGQHIDVIPNRPVQYVTQKRAPSEECTFGYIGRIEAYKGIWLALAAFSSIDAPKARFVVAGSGAEGDVQRLRDWPDTRVTLLGRVDPRDFYGSVDVVVVPSQWHESFGRVAAEAYLSGCAVVVSGIGGLPEAVDGAPAQRTRIVSDWSSVEAWARELSSLLEFRSVGAAFPGEGVGRTVADEYISIYRRVVEKQSRTVEQ